jgi:short-subunit dehydrogenase
MTQTKPLALILGGSTGIGLETARRLIAAGEDVLIVGRDQQKLNEAKASLRGRGSVETQSVDLYDESQVNSPSSNHPGLRRPCRASTAFIQLAA